MEIQHTQQCLDAREKERVELAGYKKEYPNHCHTCYGEGDHPNYEYCPKCIGMGRCPRCGSVKNNFFDSMPLGDEKPTCWECGWDEDCPGAPEVLNPYDCGCFDDSLYAVQDSERELFRPLQGQY